MKKNNYTQDRSLSFGELYSKYGTLAVLLLLIIVASVLSPNFLTVGNLFNVLRQISVIAIVGFGSTLVMMSGQINIAYDTMLALIGCVSCMIYVQFPNALVALIGAMILGAVIGAVYGVFVTKFKLPAFIVGLAVSSICEGTVLLITNAVPVAGVSRTSYSYFGTGYFCSIPVPIVIMLLVMCVVWFVLRKTVFGRHIVAVGGNTAAAKASGIQTDKVICFVYILDGIICGIASVVFMSRMGSGQPSPGTGYCFDAITGAVIGGTSLTGGTGSALGTFVGMMVVGVMNNIMNLLGLSSFWQSVFKGLIILVAVIIDIKTKESVMRSIKKTHLPRREHR